jgi:hypothetical protein
VIAHDRVRWKQGYRCLQNEPSIITRKKPVPLRVSVRGSGLGTKFLGSHGDNEADCDPEPWPELWLDGS